MKVEIFPTGLMTWKGMKLNMKSDCVIEKDTGVINLSITESQKKSLISKRKAYLSFKRVADISISSVGLICLFPLFIVISILIKLDSKGPILYKQKRIGKNGKHFVIYKFRTMVHNADNDLNKYLNENEEIKKEYKLYKKLKNDPRVTKLGRFLRRTSLDELPQLFNVFIGDMSLVGPRPYMPKEKEEMGEYYNIIIKSKPGITRIMANKW